MSMTEEADRIRADIEETRRQLSTNQDALLNDVREAAQGVVAAATSDAVGDLEMKVLTSKANLEEAEAQSVRLMFSLAGFGLLAATGVVTWSLRTILDSSVTVLVLLVLTALLAMWLVVFGFIKARLISIAARHEMLLGLKAAEERTSSTPTPTTPISPPATSAGNFVADNS
jgi:hypothetical protein